MHAWLNVGEVLRWYGMRPTTLADIAAEYLPAIRQEEPTRGLILEIDGTPAGYLQWYRIADYPEHAERCSAQPGAAGLDCFLADAWQNQGLGPAAIHLLIAQEITPVVDLDHILIDPAWANKRGIAAYRKAGFQPVRILPPEGIEPERLLMRRPVVLQ